MAEETQQGPYVSCIKSFGRPILPPLMTDEKRLLMRHFKALACEREAARAKRKREAFLLTLGEADLEVDVSEDSSLDMAHTAPPSLAADSGASLMLPVVTKLERDVRWAASDTPETGSSATLVPSSSDSEDDGTSTADSARSKHDEDEVAGHQEDETRLSPEKDLVPGTQVGPAEVPVTLTETTPAMPSTATTPKQYLQAVPTMMPVIMPMTLSDMTKEMTLAAKQVTTVTTPTTMPLTTRPKEPVMTATTQVTSPSAATLETVPMTTPPKTPMMTAVATQTSATTPMIPPPKMPVTTQGASAATLTTMAVTAPLSSPIRQECFPTKVSVPSLCRSRSFVVESPSLAQLLLRGLHRDGRDCANGTDAKIVQPCNSPTKDSFYLKPRSSERHTYATRAGERTRKKEGLNISKTFIKADHKVDSSSVISQVTDDAADESSHRLGDVIKPQKNSVCESAGEQHDLASCRNDPDIRAHVDENTEDTRVSPIIVKPTALQVPASPDRIEQASTFLGKCDSVNAHWISRVFRDTLKSFAKTNRLPTHKTPDSSFNVPFDNSSKVTGRVVPWTSSALDVVAVTKDYASVKDGAVDNTLHNIPNVPGDDSAEETVADDVFTDALDDKWAELSSASLPGFFTKDNAATARTLPMFGKTFFSDWDRGDASFAPVSPSSNRRSICSSISSIQSSFGAEHDVLALTLNSSGDVEEDEEQYEDADGHRDDQANSSAELSGSLENSGSSLDESSASSGCEHLKSLNQRMSEDDMLAAQELKLQTLCQTLAQDYTRDNRSTFAILREGAVSMVLGEESWADDDTPLEAQTAGSISPPRLCAPAHTLVTAARLPDHPAGADGHSPGRSHSGHSPSGHSPSGHSPSGHSPSGHSPSGHSPSGHSTSGHSTSGHSPSGHNPSGHSPSGHSPSGHSPSGHSPSGHSPSGHSPSGHSPSGHSPSGHSPSGHSPSGHSSSGHTSLPADLSMLRHSNEDHSRVDSSLASTSIHLDLLSETRQSLHPRWRRCFDRLTAMARGHLTRRLMKTHRVQSIIQTIKDTLECALRLHEEPHIRSGLVTPQDVELHQRLITQLTSACHELHNVFFNIPVAERMQLITQLRSQKAHPPVRIVKGCTEQAPKKISLATKKVLERRLSKLTGRGRSLKVEVKRPTAVVRSQTFIAAAPADTCHAAGAAPSGTTRKICRLPMYKV
ncbi:uncharacterized protein LOC119453834 isoform X2 [Dermacentor silvarum]|uniref:uncharacterized protein LOC119453834 isoform X2 n=1 Tax=Dermacentor silvarum TaxID=543639 RepID=UPI0021013A4E|nr:uncharacterized protein LOC119453834 isoform X2 [Dermacentor silvarum]